MDGLTRRCGVKSAMLLAANDALAEIRNRLVAALQPKAMYLFVSHAWGSPTPYSDLDLLVIVAQSSEGTAQRAVRAYQALAGVRTPVDVIVRTEAEMELASRVRASLEHKILTEGQLIYG